ncbi:TPA: YdbC family protein [Streptococcus agalactiae]
MKEIQYEIVKEIAVLSASDSGYTKEIAVLSASDSGYTKEINLISWNGREPKYDIRSFSPNREKCGKGITLNADEAAALLEALQKEVNSGD